MEKVSVCGARMPRGRHHGATAQHHLIDHELPVILTDRPWCCPVAWIWAVSAFGKLPDITGHFGKLRITGSRFPLELRRQTGTGPAGKSVSFIPTDVMNRRIR